MALNNTPTFSVDPSSTKVATENNYVSKFDYTSQYDVDTHEEMANIFGNRSVTGML